MTIVSFGVSSQPLPSTGGALAVQTKSYTWNSSFGLHPKLDVIEFPPLAAIFRIGCNFPVRVRLYSEAQQQQVDLTRPPSVAPVKGVNFDGLLGGLVASQQLQLSPLCFVTGVSPVTIEKLLPDAATINLLFELVG